MSGTTTRQEGRSGGDIAGATLSVGEVLSVHGEMIRHLAFRHAPTPADADDLFQEIAVALWKALPTFRGESALRTFIYSVARKRCLSFQARIRRRSAREVPINVCESGDALPSVEPVGPAAVELARRNSDLYSAIDSLPSAQRQTLRMRLAGLSDREIATHLQISESATAVRLFRARARLRTLLTTHPDPEGPPADPERCASAAC